MSGVGLSLGEWNSRFICFGFIGTMGFKFRFLIVYSKKNIIYFILRVKSFILFYINI